MMPKPMIYPEDHPLYGRDAEWIAETASKVASFEIPSREASLRIHPSTFCALVHEHKRLSTEVEELKKQLAAWRRTCETTDDAYDRIEHAKERSRDYGPPTEPSCLV